jgi:NAD-dependent dihydropyrimidine dehydrogenase PreA subunit
MTHVITEPCIDSRDQSCVDVCPVDCIYETERMLVIHPVECIDCGACIPECPVAAIVREEDIADEQTRFIAVNAAIVDGTGAVTAALASAG